MQKCFIVSPEDLRRAAPDEEVEPGAEPLYAAPAILQRHAARVLAPDADDDDAQWPAPMPTVYRARTLLLPPDLHDEESLVKINEVLGDVGMSLVPAPAAPDPAAEAGIAVARPAVLQHAADNTGDVDAGKALAALRAAARAGRRPGQPALNAEDVQRISLEHVLTSAAITGQPIVHSNIAGEPIVHSNAPDGEPIVHSNAAIASYLYASQDARSPVDIAMPAPARKSAEESARQYGRRPVIAVLDTGIRAHPWLDVETGPDYQGYGYASERDSFGCVDGGFIQVDQGLQDAIYARAKHVSDAKSARIRYPWDESVETQSVLPVVDSHTGHGTFIAGIVRQVVPDATVLSIRIMHGDGVVYEGDLLHALALVAARVARSHESGDPALMIDAVSLSLGYYNDSYGSRAYTSELRRLIDRLLGLGVVVVTAAGNATSRRRYYPAAFAGRPVADGHLPVLSVGALNPNGSRTAFSDAGRWVRAWASGAAVVSTFPADVNGPGSPDIEVPGDTLSATVQSLDRDDFRGGFVVWSGTSFSAPVLAAYVVRAMLDPLSGPAPEASLRLDKAGARPATDRALRAIQHLQPSA
jgi:hypothetical protein